jgi:uncharacterized protein (DUF305 family)
MPKIGLKTVVSPLIYLSHKPLALAPTAQRSSMHDKIIYGILGLLLGIVLTILFTRTAVTNQNPGMMRMMGMSNMMGGSTMMDEHHDGTTMSMTNAMHAMMEGLANKTGDEFDKAFLAEMIIHHEGAITMANAALKNAQHQEIKSLATDIISAQTREINQMQQWQQAWYNQ